MTGSTAPLAFVVACALPRLNPCFRANTPEEKHDEKLQKFIKEYELEDLDEDSAEEIFQASDVTTKSYFSALVKQNVIMIKQLNKLNENIEKLLDK